jgi:hypothetical protein
MRVFTITTNLDSFCVNAISATHARQIAGKKLREGEWIESVL